MEGFSAGIGLVGLGLMGSSLAMALRRAGARVRLIGVDTDPTVVAKASAGGFFDQAGLDLEAVRGCDLVVLAAPIQATRELLPRLAGIGGVVTDLCSSKGSVMAWAAEAGLDLVGGHPMCGRELSGIDAARADLFDGAPWILTREEPLVLEVVGRVGARPLVMDAAEHDRLVAGVSHAAFLLAVAYTLSVSRSPDWPAMAELAAGGFRDMTRLAAGDPALYQAIVDTNAANAAFWLASIEKVLAEMRKRLAGEGGNLLAEFEEAQLARDRWAARRP